MDLKSITYVVLIFLALLLCYCIFQLMYEEDILQEKKIQKADVSKKFNVIVLLGPSNTTTQEVRSDSNLNYDTKKYNFINRLEMFKNMARSQPNMYKDNDRIRKDTSLVRSDVLNRDHRDVSTYESEDVNKGDGLKYEDDKFKDI